MFVRWVQNVAKYHLVGVTFFVLLLSQRSPIVQVNGSLTLSEVDATIVAPYFFSVFFFTASIVWALGRSNLFSSNTRCLGNRFLSWKFRVALYTISYKQLTMKKRKDFKLNSVMKSFYTQIYWYLVYGRYQILNIQNGGSNMAALS